ncbi:VOC family protein [Aquibacillus salsiterrae]|uniref:VOC family protein n=1 Tax=Aquibacillus salsiterrae TaxID=2950439 RepID=A0A9X3WG98_9BACI|nr:VOC family protein [Aquibacillus salsiterrae]MDC3416899.1 VOC family protein [Aquibacillus salsiterrae]
MINLERFHHVSLSIKDLAKAKHFYGEILGFPEIERPDFDFPGAWYQVGDQQLHLIVFEESETLRNSQEIQTKDGHMAVRVKDYYETLDYLKKMNVDIVEKPNSQSGFAQLFCADPDGNLIEFNVDQEDLKK